MKIIGGFLLVVYSKLDIEEAVKLAEHLGVSEFLYQDPRGQRTSRRGTGRYSSRSSCRSSRSSRHGSSHRSSCYSRNTASLLTVPAALIAVPAVLYVSLAAVLLVTVPAAFIAHHSSRSSRCSSHGSSHRSSRFFRRSSKNRSSRNRKNPS